MHKSLQHLRIASRLLWRCRAKPAGRAVWAKNSEHGVVRSLIERLPCGCREKCCSSGEGMTDTGPRSESTLPII